jgi:catechol 2,3-dioxygenase-like lactoylglutathione lyase family enzyme
LSNLRSHFSRNNFALRNDILATVGFRVSSIDHVQVAAPAGCEQIARDFYGSLLGMVEVQKPAVLRARGGCWFQCGAQQLHVGVEKSFQPAKKAHPAFAVSNLDGLRKALRERGISPVEDDAIPGTQRFYVDDPWGNRLEFVEAGK